MSTAIQTLSLNPINGCAIECLSFQSGAFLPLGA